MLFYPRIPAIISSFIENSNCEDGVNFVRSNGYIDNLNVLNSNSSAMVGVFPLLKSGDVWELYLSIEYIPYCFFLDDY